MDVGNTARTLGVVQQRASDTAAAATSIASHARSSVPGVPRSIDSVLSANHVV